MIEEIKTFEQRKEEQAKSGSKDAPKTCKESVFADADWVCTGSIASREKGRSRAAC